jgi:ketosteroid isomerase-like protein
MVNTAARTVVEPSVVRLAPVADPRTSEALEFVREAVLQFDVRECSLEEYFGRYWDPDGVIDFVDGFPISGTYRGVEGFKQWFADSYGPYEDVKRRLDSLEAIGDRIVSLLTISGRPKGEDTELELQVGNVYELEGGRIAHLDVYVGHERARRAALDGG